MEKTLFEADTSMASGRRLLEQVLVPIRANTDDERRRKEVVACALGYLFSYCTLLAYPSDFRIAKDNYLLPDSITWEQWRGLAAQVLANHRPELIHRRFWYGISRTRLRSA